MLSQVWLMAGIVLVSSTGLEAREIRFDPGTCGSVTMTLKPEDEGATCIVVCGVGSASASCQHARSDLRVRPKLVRDSLASLSIRVFGRVTVLDLGTHLQDMTGWELDTADTLLQEQLAEFGWIGSVGTIESLRIPLRDGRFLELQADTKERAIVARVDDTLSGEAPPEIAPGAAGARGTGSSRKQHP